MRGDQPVSSAASWIVRASILGPTLPRVCQGWALCAGRVKSCSRALPAAELALEPLDHRHRRRVYAAQDGEVERHEVAEQDEREEPLGAGLALRLDAEGRRRLGGDQPAGQLD